MKILYHHRIASKDGQYVHIEEIINAFRKLGHEVIVVAPSVSERTSFGSDGGWVSILRQYLPKFFAELLEFCYTFYAFVKLVFVIIKYQPDIIYERYNLFSPAGIWAKKCFNLPLILEVNSPLYDERLKYGGLALSALARWSEHYTWRHADHLLPVTQVLAGFMRKVNVSDEHITVIANGVNPQYFSPNHNIIRKTEFQGKVVLGFVGFCRGWHQLDKVLSLIANAKQLNLLLLIVGDGPASNLLKQKAHSLDITDRLYITGIISREAMPAWLDQIDIALQPAVTPWSSPLKLIEYLGKGKAIIAPKNQNILELLTHEHNALLYDAKSNDDLLCCIERLVTDELLREKLAHMALQTIKNKRLTWEQNAKRIIVIASSLVNQNVGTVKEM